MLLYPPPPGCGSGLGHDSDRSRSRNGSGQAYFTGCRSQHLLSSRTMNLPPSALLGRLEAFLPEMEKANQTTEKLAQEGKLEVLDSHLEIAGSDQQTEGTEEAEVDEEEATEGVEQEEDGAEPGASPPTRTVQLDFALGDFDDTPIAKMEQEKEVAASQVEGVEAGTGEEQEDAAEDGGVAGLLRVVPETRVDAEAPREPRKPLIEEL